MGEDGAGAESSDFCGTRSGGGRYAGCRGEFAGRGSWRAGRPPDLFGWGKTGLRRDFPTSVVRGREEGGRQAAAASLQVVGAGGPDSLQTSPPVRRRNRAASFSALRPSGPYIAGRRPATPQSPERLRSTPFDCVAIAPCCFAERKAVLSHSARLRSTASQLLLAALRNAKQSSHMRSRR